jgi:Cu(I)/Ag(I) efflux system membrane protein CusA/SilA
MIEKLIDYCARHKFLVFFVLAFVTVAGFWSIANIPLDALPDLSDVQVIIFTEWPGRSPDLVEDQVSYPIITSMLAAPKVKVVRGYSYFGLSFVNVIFDDGTDLYWARSRVLEYLSKIKTQLPDGATPTLGPDATGVGWVYQYALVDTSGKNSLADLRTFQDFYLKYWLESLPGVAEVASVGGFQKQYQVRLDPNKLLAKKVSPSMVIAAVRRSNNDVGGRSVEISGREFFIRGRGYIRGKSDLEQVVVALDPASGTPVRLSDVADIAYGPEMRRGIAELDGTGEVVGGIVVMRHGENALKTIQRVKAKLAEIEPGLPPGVEIREVYDRSELIDASIDTLRETLIEESIIVSLIIVLFLFHVRSALVAIITLPVAIIISFIPMFLFDISSNIMSLGGIAIAIGAMVDAAIVLVENAHKKLDHYAGAKNRVEVIIEAAKEVGRPIFFSLLIITISFLPVFTLEAQEGRLFKPLAYTKTFAMFFAALLSITLAPALMVLLIRGRILPERKNPVSVALRWVFDPVTRFIIRFRWAVIALALIAVVATVPVYFRLGSEFMPPLNEGSILYMPTTLPGISITEAGRLLHTQDKLLAQVPEIKSVFGKVGRAATSTDPAPLMMVETTIMLKPEEQWRPGMTWEKLIRELDALVKFPGVTNAWTMPIKGRIDMLTTGIKTPVGIKVFGKDLNEIDKLGKKIEAVLRPVRGTRSVYSEWVTGGYFIDFTPRRSEIARYGLNVEDVTDIVETAVGGKNVDTTIEGRERYKINVRYAPDYRDNLDKLSRVLVHTPTGADVPIGRLADIRLQPGPPSIKDENGSLSGWIFVDVDESLTDLGSYVARAKEAVAAAVRFPEGYYPKWTGQYEFLERIQQKLILVLPITIVLIIFLLYLNFKSLAPTLMVLVSLPFALVGGVWLLFLLGYNLSVAVWVGIIALLGVAAETGVVMLVYLDEAYNRRKQQGLMNSRADLYEAVREGAGQRVRPKLMTVLTTVIALLPLMWSAGAGADVMKRIAAPMVGGLITSMLLTLFIFPAVYTVWKSFTLK